MPLIETIGSGSSRGFGRFGRVAQGNGLTSLTAGESALQIKQDFPSSNSGTYWIKVNGTPTQIYCNMSILSGGWMSMASAPGSGAWTAMDTGSNANWNNLNYSFGTYSTNGSIGSYWRNYSGQNPTQLLFLTGNGTYWVSFPIDYVRQASDGVSGVSNVAFTSNVTTSNNFPTDSFVYNSSLNIMHRAPQLEDPWITIGNTHAGGNNYTVWGESSNPSHTTFKNANGGILVFIK
jgi:hypothetical protein